MKKLIMLGVLVLVTAIVAFGQAGGVRIPQKTLLAIVKAEDELRFDEVLKPLLANKNRFVQARAALAAGRIGDEKSLPYLSSLAKDSNEGVRRAAIFAIGEIESEGGVDSIVEVLEDPNSSNRAEAIEAAGKIAAANSKNEKLFAKLGSLITKSLGNKVDLDSRANDRFIQAGITAILRAKPVDSEPILKKFANHSNARIRADVFNALARTGAANSLDIARIAINDVDPEVRANASRLLGKSQEKSDYEILISKAKLDSDSRVRTNSIRSLGSTSSPLATAALLNLGNLLLEKFKRGGDVNGTEKNELVTIFSSLSNLLKGSKDKDAINLLVEFRNFAGIDVPEAEIALASIAPEEFLSMEFQPRIPPKSYTYLMISASTQALSGIEALANNRAMRDHIRTMLMMSIPPKVSESAWMMSLPGILEVYSKFDSEDLNDVLLKYLDHPDVFVRASTASIIGNRKSDEKFLDALEKAFDKSLQTDLRYDDAQFALLEALVKLDKSRAKSSIERALDHYSILVRRKAASLVNANGMNSDFPTLKQRVGFLTKYDPKNRSRLGQVTNTEKDYLRAITRKNGKSRAILSTAKGEITIELLPEDAPLTVDNFIKLADEKYFDGIEIHRVVPNFVVQDGDPRGDGNGGPGWQIRCEINFLPFTRGMVGMALSGKDTGGSQWFVTHSAQPHLDGGYTVFGRVNEHDMLIVDKLVRSDKIKSVRIIDEK